MQFIRLTVTVLFICYIIESLRQIEFCLLNHLEQFDYQKFEMWGWNDNSFLDNK